MDVGLQMVFASYGWTDVSDETVWDEEIKLARLAADSGFAGVLAHLAPRPAAPAL